MAFVHLHGHDEFSILDGVGTSKMLAERAASLGQPALAQTNHASLSGSIHHHSACAENGIMPILGCEIYFRPDRLVQTKEANWDFWHMTVLAKNVRGWQNLKRLTSESYRSGFYRKPCADLELLERFHEGLIVSTGCFSGYACDAVIRGDDAALARHVADLDRIFGDDWYVEIQPHDFDGQRQINNAMIDVAARAGKPVVATNDFHYPYPEWADTQDVSLMISTRQTMATREKKRESEETVYEFHAKTLYLADEADMRRLFLENHKDIPGSVVEEALSNTMAVASMISPIVFDRSDKLPRYTGDKDRDMRILRGWIDQGLRDMGRKGDPVYEARIEQELQVFVDLDVVEFFLITADMVRWAKDNGIAVGAGRGSAAGSLVCRACRITAVDPITYDLKFERFLNPNRRGLPDIDVDFDPSETVRVEQYLVDKYGQEKVVNLIAHGTFGARGAIKRVGRVFGLNEGMMNTVTKKIDDKMTDERLERIRLVVPEVERFANDYPDVWRHACRLQGQVQSMSEHPAGVVLADRALEEAGLPVMKAHKSDPYMVTAWGESGDFPIVSKLGFLKIDMLRTDGLRKQKYACEVIRRRTGEEIDLERLPALADPMAVEPEVMDIFCRGLTHGIWQFGSPGMTSMVRKVQPENMLHLAAQNALYRPGPMDDGMHEEYADLKNGRSPVQFWHPVVEPALGNTFGLMAYQEQVMQIVQDVAGFSLAYADDIRRVMSKEYRSKDGRGKAKLEAMRAEFVAGAWERNRIPERYANEIWNKIGGFSSYSFNLSHAVVYAVQSYADAWLKYHYPWAFYASMLTFPPKGKTKWGEDKRTVYVEKVIREARELNLKILPPDINESEEGFTVVDAGIRYGLGQIKGMGDVTARKVIEGRAFGPYTSRDQVKKRTQNKVNEGHLKALTAAGAFDAFGARDRMTVEERAEAEAIKLGAALSTPDKLKEYADFLRARVHTQDEVESLPNNSPVCVGGELISGAERETRNGGVYCKAQLAFGPSTYNLTIWPENWSKYKHLFERDEPFLVHGIWDQVWSSVVVSDIELCADVKAGVEDPVAA